MNNQKTSIEINSEEFQEILIKPPSMLMKAGMYFLLCLMLLLTLLSIFLKYPDIIKADITIFTSQPPKVVVARTSGPLARLFVKENETVKKGQTLGVIQNNADVEEVERLSELLDNKLPSDLVEELSTNNRSLTLGHIQEQYSKLVSSVRYYEFQLQSDPEVREAGDIKKELKEYRSLLKKQFDQLALSIEEQEISEKDLERNKNLFIEKAISERDLDEAKKHFIGVKKNIENNKISISNTQIKIIELEKELTQLDIYRSKNFSEIEQRISNEVNDLKVAILEWEDKFLIKAPIDGKVTFFNYWNENQYLHAGEEVFTVVPESDGKIIGRMFISTIRAGKVMAKQKVQIKLDGFPYEEYGFVSAEVKSISLVPKQGKYVVEVILNNGLKTSFKQEVQFMQEMKGEGEIITEDMRLIERFFNGFRRVLEK